VSYQEVVDELTTRLDITDERHHIKRPERKQVTTFVCWKSSLTIIRCLIGTRAHTPCSKSRLKILSSRKYLRELGWELRRCERVMLFVALCTVLWTTLYFFCQIVAFTANEHSWKAFYRTFCAHSRLFYSKYVRHSWQNEITGVAFGIFVCEGDSFGVEVPSVVWPSFFSYGKGCWNLHCRNCYER